MKVIYFVGFICFIFSCQNHQVNEIPQSSSDSLNFETTLNEYPFSEEIKRYQKEDKLKFPPQNCILFIGSSTIRIWKSLSSDLDGLNVVNRGFGGAKTEHILYYTPYIVLPYKPSKIVFYCGDNDIASGVPIPVILNNYSAFIKMIHDTLPQTKIYFISNKPILKRPQDIKKLKSVNESLKRLCNRFSFVTYIDVCSKMIQHDSIIISEYYRKDSIHLNRKGYELWGKIIREKIK